MSLREKQTAFEAAKEAEDSAMVPVLAAKGELESLLPTADEYEIAALRVWEDGVVVNDVAAQNSRFGVAVASSLRASLASKEAASPAKRVALRSAQRAAQPAVDALHAAKQELEKEQGAKDA